MKDLSILDGLITGRVEPHIYMQKRGKSLRNAHRVAERNL